MLAAAMEQETNESGQASCHADPLDIQTPEVPAVPDLIQSIRIRIQQIEDESYANRSVSASGIKWTTSQDC